MNVSILAVGTELLFGQTINTNAAYLSERLNQMGFNVLYHFVVGDNPSRLKEMLSYVFERSDMVITTGGLGPTQDDLTKEIVCEYLGAEMYKDERALSEIEAHFAKTGRNMPENNIKQAILPVGSTVFYNASGTAPAFALEQEGKIAICLPGPPRELSWLYENGVKDYLESFTHKKTYYRVIRTMGIGESHLETALLPLIDGQTDPTIATYAKGGECSVRVTSQKDTLNEAEEAVNQMICEIDKLIGEYIFSYNDENINEVVVKKLIERGLTVSAAESCTGGKFASAITDVPGSSAVMGSSYVTYSIDSKVKELGVDKAVVDSKGVVSPEVAVAMAQGALSRSGSNIAVSVTGFAGPDADEGFNAGDAFIGYAHYDNDGKVSSGYVEYSRNRIRRDWNREEFTLTMLRTVYLILKGSL